MNVLEAFNTLNISSEKVSQKEIKNAYRKAISKYHPDRADAGQKLMYTELAKAINAAYKFLSSLKNDVENKEFDQSKSCNYAYELLEVLQKIHELDGVVIEVCGIWVWVTGDTKKHKDALGKNGIGCHWSHDKKAWYYRPATAARRFGGKRQDMASIRAKYGSSSYSGQRKYSQHDKELPAY
jgi:curved DNA-binding protein CbpA